MFRDKFNVNVVLYYGIKVEGIGVGSMDFSVFKSFEWIEVFIKIILFMKVSVLVVVDGKKNFEE